MLLDMHVHTSVYSPCGKMLPHEMAQRAREVGFDGLVITEHDAIWTKEEIEDLRADFPDLAFFRGVEISAKGHHVLVYGTTDLSGFERGMAVVDAVNEAHRQGAVAVFAHPLRYSLQLKTEDLAADFDACETRSTNIEKEEWDAYSQLAKRLGVPEMSNSDAHNTGVMGAYATRFPEDIKDERDLAEAIRCGAFSVEVRTEWLDEVIEARAANYDVALERMLARGITEPEKIKSRIGGSVERIAQLLAAKEGIS